MNRIARLLAACALALTAVPVTVAVTSTQAEACAMRAPKRMKSPQKMVADARRAEKRGETRTAIRHYERAMNHYRASDQLKAQAALAAGRLHLQADREERAVQRFKAAARLDSQLASAWMALGESQLVANNHDAAIDSLNKALKGTRETLSRTDRGEVEAMLAAAHAHLGELDEARSSLKRARTLGANPRAIQAVEGLLSGAAEPAVKLAGGA